MSMIVPYEHGQTRREPFYPISPHGTLGFPLYPNSHASSPLMDPMPSPRVPENQSNGQSDDFFRFVEKKAKPMSELNPFATEFSLPKTQSDSTGTSTEKLPPYRLIFNDLVEKSLQSIEVITKAAKLHAVHHASVQCESTSPDQVHRSTQTKDESEKQHLLDEYCTHSIRLIDRLAEIFKTVLPMSSTPDVLHEYQSMSRTCAELRHSISLIHQLGSTTDLINVSNPATNDLFLPSSMMMFDSGGRGRRLISSSINEGPAPFFSSPQVDPIARVRSKMCLLCQKPLLGHQDGMHPSCRLLSSPANGSDDN